MAKQKEDKSKNEELAAALIEENLDELAAEAGLIEKPEVKELGQPPQHPGLESEVFSLGEWKGFQKWTCNFCPWDTLEGESVMVAHYVARHKPKEFTPSGTILIAKN